MAPSNMFHYLRPHHNKRTATAPVPISPEPAHASTQQHISSPSLHQPEYFSSPRIPDSSGFTSSSPVSPYPPVLPPIPRVASRIERVHPGSALTSPEPHPPPQPHEPINEHQIIDGDRSWSTSRVQQGELSSNYDGRHPARSGAPDTPTGLRAKGRSMSDNVGYDGISGQPSLQITPPDVVTKTSTFSHSQVSLLSSFMDKSSNSSKSANSAPAQPQKIKSRLNLRNPMSLLMRRRSGQPVENLSEESLVSHRTPTLPAMPDDYDPRIRGHIVHDFSAPRPRRNFSYNNAYADEQKSTDMLNVADAPSGRLSPAKIERAYTPVFREHFDDDTSYEESQAAIRAEQLVNHEFLKRNSIPPPARSPPPPPMPKEPPPAPPQPIHAPPPPPEIYTELNTEPFPSSLLSPVQEVASPTGDAISGGTPGKKRSTKTPPSSRSRAASITDPTFSPAGLPAHLTSRSSRFSFQIAGNDSAQEKLLEERHKQKAAEKASKEARMSTNTFEDDYDENMYDYDMDDGGYEEEIPMLGEDDGFGGDEMSPGMNAFDFSTFAPPLNTLMSPMSMTGEDVVQTPRDANGNAIGFAVSEDVNAKAHVPAPDGYVSSTGAPLWEANGIGLVDINHSSIDHSRFTPADTPEEMHNNPVEAEIALSRPEDVDDLYFDDGMIDDQGEIGNHEFDENVFDDPTHPFYERSIKNMPTELTVAVSGQAPGTDNDGARYSIDDDLSQDIPQEAPALAHKNSVAQQNPLPDISSLNAYHSALADAAHKAQAEGRFTRKESIDYGGLSSDEVDVSSSLSNSRPSLIPDDGRFSQETTGFPPDDLDMSSSFVDDYSDYDSALEDDPMIAAANAEALANDYEGFYGQEFGFYASAHGEAQNAYGGYFGPSGLGRSVSGRNAVREPNLTPITERSEYSTRNSFVSLSHFRDGQQPLQSPGLAQLARMSPYGWPDEEPDMSLSSLMKLRKDAFGGSAISLGSSAGSSPRNSSPAGMTYLPRNASPMTNYPLASSELEDSIAMGPTYDMGDEGDDEALDAVNAMSDTSSHYDEEQDEETHEGNDSPTLTASDYYMSLSSPDPYRIPHRYHNENLKTLPRQSAPPPTLTLSTTTLTPQHSDHNNQSSPISAPPNRSSLGLISPISSNSPLTPGGSGAWKTTSGPSHSRKGSAADSVAYVREHDEQGGDRWVLERRRTAESGELELVGREIVEGGRI